MSSEDPTSSDAVEERQDFDLETLKEYSCRYYENEYPEIEDLVVVKVMEYILLLFNLLLDMKKCVHMFNYWNITILVV